MNSATCQLFLILVLLAIPGASNSAESLQFREQELKTRLGVGYAVRLVDLNADDRLDICIVDQERILWLASPQWEEHVMIEGQTEKDNVCFAPHDIDGDGKLDFAVGAAWNPGNTQAGGTIQWIRQGARPTDRWTVHPIGAEPTTHRMQFVPFLEGGAPQLIVAPLLGRNTTRPNFQENAVRLLAFRIPDAPQDPNAWKAEVLNEELHVCHNFAPYDFNRDQRTDLLVVSFEGLHVLERQNDGSIRRTQIGVGDQQSMPNRGASEVRAGQLHPGKPYIATIEPWHGNQVVVYTPPEAARPKEGPWLWQRRVLDDQLQWGHAVVTANLDDDPADELIIGVRDDLNEQERRGLRIYDPAEDGQSWRRIVVDPGSVAIEDLAAGDLNGDGRTDIVAVGRQTHNVKIYWNETKPAK